MGKGQGRLNDTSAIKALGLRPAGMELAADQSPWGNCQPAYGSADMAVEPKPDPDQPWVPTPEPRPRFKNPTAGSESLSTAAKICKE